MARYPVKPPTPVFRPSAPGAANCKICLPMCHYERGRQTIRNIAPNSKIRDCEIQATYPPSWSSDEYGPALEVTNTGSTGVRVGALADALENPYETTFVIAYKKYSTAAATEGIFSDSFYGTVNVCDVGSGNPHELYFRYGRTTYTRIYGYWIVRYKLHLMVLTAGSNGGEVWLDGILRGSDAGVPTNFDLSSGYFHLFDDSGASGLSKMSYFARYDKVLSHAEIADIFSDPWGMIRPAKTFIDLGYVPTGGPAQSIVPIVLQAHGVC